MIVTEHFLSTHGMLTRIALEHAYACRGQLVHAQSVIDAFPPGMPPTARVNVHRTLERLARAGVLQKRAAGRYRWHPLAQISAPALALCDPSSSP